MSFLQHVGYLAVGALWVLQRVKYVTPHFFEEQKHKIKAIYVGLEQFKMA